VKSHKQFSTIFQGQDTTNIENMQTSLTVYVCLSEKVQNNDSVEPNCIHSSPL